MKKLLTGKELMTKLGITDSKFKQLINAGLKPVNGTELFSWYAVKKFLRNKGAFFETNKS